VSAALLVACTLAYGALCTVGCSVPKAEPSSAPRAVPAVPRAPAARWVYRPKGPQPISARMALDAAQLVVDRGGSRWLVRAAGPPEAAAYGAPEALVAARPSEGGFVFVGDSGAVYSAGEPLGPFVSVRRPPQLSFGATAVEDVVLCVGQDGKLRRSADLGRSWQVVPIDGFVTDVALDRQGRALAVSVPEQWFWSTDRGASFRAITPGTVAPEELDGSGEQIRVTGWLGVYDFDGTAFRPSKTAVASKATWTLPKGPSALDVRSAQATLAEDYLALVPGKDGLTLLHGQLGGPLREHAATGLTDCARYRVASRAARVAVLCADKGEAGTSAALALWLGDVHSAHFERHALALRGDFDRTRLALSPDGSLALSGVCPPTEQAPGCVPRGVHRLELGAKKLDAVPAAFEEMPLALAFSAAGELLVAGVREKDGHALLLAWTPARAGLGRLFDLSSELDLAARASNVELLLGRAPLLGVLVHHAEGVAAASLDDAGRVMTFGKAPAETVAIHGAGLRLAAVSSARSSFFESDDGGLTWAESALPRPLCPAARSDCTPVLVCSDVGCLLGDELTRVGWGSLAAPSDAIDGGASREPGSRAAVGEFSCRLDAERPLALPQLLEVPGAAEAALGDADFTVVQYDPETAAVEFSWVLRGQRRLEHTVGLGGVAEPESYALSVVPQVEGAAALRYRMPVRQTGDRMLSEIEVAWNNRLVGVTGHQRFPSLVEGRQGDYHPAATGPGEAFPQLLSVAGRGLYLALHRVGAPAQATYYFEGGSLQQLPPAPLPEALADASDAEYIRVGQAHVPLAFAPNRARVLLGSALASNGTEQGGEPGVALLLGEASVASVRAQGMRLSYRGGRIGVVSMMADLDGTFWAARFAELGGTPGQVLGDVVRAPLKPDLDRVPRACSEVSRQTTPRIVAPPFPGPTPLLRVKQGSEELGRFVLGSAVLHGTPEDACLAAWAGDPEGAGLGTAGSAGAGVLLLPTEAGFSGWFFSARAEERLASGFDAWPLSCELEE